MPLVFIDFYEKYQQKNGDCKRKESGLPCTAKEKHCTKFANFHCVKCVRPIKLSCYEDICIFVQHGGILGDFTFTPSALEKLLPL